MNRLNRIMMLGLALFVAIPLFAQYERLGGVYYAYPITETKMNQAPEGYEPFYISHYGRHGSRWLTSDNRYIGSEESHEVGQGCAQTAR